MPYYASYVIVFESLRFHQSFGRSSMDDRRKRNRKKSLRNGMKLFFEWHTCKPSERKLVAKVKEKSLTSAGLEPTTSGSDHQCYVDRTLINHLVIWTNYSATT